MNIDWYMNFLYLKEEYYKKDSSLSLKETRYAILNSQTKTSKLDSENQSKTHSSNSNKFLNQIEERDRLKEEIEILKEVIIPLKDKFLTLLNELEEYIKDPFNENYLETNIFYYRFASKKKYTLLDIQYKLGKRYEESQIKKISAELTVKIAKEFDKRKNDRTEIVL